MGRQCLSLYGATLLCRWTGPVRVVGPDPLPPFCGDALLDMNPWKLMVPCGSSPEHLSVVGFSLRKWALDGMFPVPSRGMMLLQPCRQARARSQRLAFRERLHGLLRQSDGGLTVVAP